MHKSSFLISTCLKYKFRQQAEFLKIVRKQLSWWGFVVVLRLASDMKEQQNHKWLLIHQQDRFWLLLQREECCYVDYKKINCLIYWSTVVFSMTLERSILQVFTRMVKFSSFQHSYQTLQLSGVDGILLSDISKFCWTGPCFPFYTITNFNDLI